MLKKKRYWHQRCFSEDFTENGSSDLIGTIEDTHISMTTSDSVDFDEGKDTDTPMIGDETAQLSQCDDDLFSQAIFKRAR